MSIEGAEACTQCGSPIAAKDNFCSSCGTKKVVAQKPTVAKKKYCENCSAPADFSVTECGNCFGTAFTHTKPENIDESAPVTEAPVHDFFKAARPQEVAAPSEFDWRAHKKLIIGSATVIIGFCSLIFFTSVFKNYASTEQIILSADSSLQARICVEDDRLIFLKSQISFQNSKAEGSIKRANAIQAQIDGYVEENPVGRFARLRAIPDVVYFPVLFLLASGEILITAPALIDLFNDLEWVAYIIAGAVGLLTVVFAHILGISLKMKLDRHRPQEGWVIKLLIPLSTVVVTAVVILAVFRSGQTLDKLANFNVVTSDMGQKLFLFGFFLILQLAFISVAAMLAFLHYSQLEHDLRAVKRELRVLEKANKALIGEYDSLASQSFLSEDIIKVAREELVARIEVIESNYAAAAAIYCDSNIHARRDAIDAAHVSMIPPKFDFQVDTFEDLIQLSTNYGSASNNDTRE